MDGKSGARDQLSRSESQVLLGQKRSILDAEEVFGSRKTVKLSDLRSVFRPFLRIQAGGGKKVDSDTNFASESSAVCSDAPMSIDESNNPSKEEVKSNYDIAKAKGLDIDLNIEFYPYKNYDQLKLREESDCGSSVGALDEKDSMRVWKGLKQNNYMSALYGAVPRPLPKSRPRKKSNDDGMKRKIELAKKEQVDRFARIAAPSGLLNGLNPGIINHVRNSKQVHSIIEAVVKSKRTEDQLSENNKYNQTKCGVHEAIERKEQGDVISLGINASGFSHGERGRQQATASMSSKSVYTEDVAQGHGNSHKTHLAFSKMHSQCNDKLERKLVSSVTVASENASCLSNDESANLGSVTSLSFKAANVASQWLELLNQDVRGRLAALRRSKKRVRAVITTELPLLLSKEFSLYSDKDLDMTQGANSHHLNQLGSDAHSVRWTSLFAQMDKALSEEESHLENWLNQVKEMQLHCENGLYRSGFCHTSLQTVLIGHDSRSGAADNSDKDFAVRAAAASIYSTCNFLLSAENSPCC